MCDGVKLLRDKVAIVTGSSRGIGAETAKLLAAHGAKVAVNYNTSRERAEQVLAEIRPVSSPARRWFRAWSAGVTAAS